MPLPRSEVAAATVGDELVLAGGFLADGRSSKRVDAYSPAREPLAAAADLPVAVNHAMAASDGHRLYVVGGYGAPDARPFSRAGAGGGCRASRSRAPRRARRSSAGRSTSIGGVAAGGLAQTVARLRPPCIAAGRGSRGRSRASTSASARSAAACTPSRGARPGRTSTPSRPTFPGAAAGSRCRRVPETRRRHRLGLGRPAARLGRQRVACGNVGRRCTRSTCAPAAGAACPTCRPRGTGWASLGFGGRVYVDRRRADARPVGERRERVPAASLSDTAGRARALGRGRGRPPREGADERDLAAPRRRRGRERDRRQPRSRRARPAADATALARALRGDLLRPRRLRACSGRTRRSARCAGRRHDRPGRRPPRAHVQRRARRASSTSSSARAIRSSTAGCRARRRCG